MSHDKFKNYKFKEVITILFTLVVIVILFDTKGILKWANNLSIGNTRNTIMNTVKPIKDFTSRLNLDKPKEKFDSIYVKFSGIKSEAGFENTASNDTINYHVKVDSVKKKEVYENRNKVFTKSNRLKILLVGDSMMGWGFGSVLEDHLRKDSSIFVKRFFKVSSGLSRLDFFNWFAQMKELLAENNYDLVIIMLGTNDGQGWESNGNIFAWGTQKWEAGYLDKVHSFFDLILSSASNLVWIGLPPMEKLHMIEIASKVNRAAKTECTKHTNAYYVDTTPLFGNDNGEYTLVMNYNNKPAKMRTDDGIHFSIPGSNKLAKYIYSLIHKNYLEVNEKYKVSKTIDNKKADSKG